MIYSLHIALIQITGLKQIIRECLGTESLKEYTPYLTIFLKVTQHQNGLALELPDHPPEVTYCFPKWCLSGYVSISQFVALCSHQ